MSDLHSWCCLLKNDANLIRKWVGSFVQLNFPRDSSSARGKRIHHTEVTYIIIYSYYCKESLTLSSRKMLLSFSELPTLLNPPLSSNTTHLKKEEKPTQSCWSLICCFLGMFHLYFIFLDIIVNSFQIFRCQILPVVYATVHRFVLLFRHFSFHLKRKEASNNHCKHFERELFYHGGHFLYAIINSREWLILSGYLPCTDNKVNVI